MDTNTMRKMIVLRDVQSNIIEEAYIVFKNNVKVHNTNKVDKGVIKEKNQKINDKDYMVKEAEMVINEYISKLEDVDYNINKANLKQNYIRLRIITVSLLIYSLINLILLIIK